MVPLMRKKIEGIVLREHTEPILPEWIAKIRPIEGIISQNGQILGKMGHTERFEEGVFTNIAGNKYQPLFDNAVKYFRKK